MTANPNFPAPVVAMAVLTAAIDLLVSFYEISINHVGKEATAKTKSARNKLEKLLRKEADYVKNIAEGDEAIILSSGFEPTKVPEPRTLPEFKVLMGQAPGQVILVHKAVKGSTAYLWQYSKDSVPADDKLWVLAGASSQAKCIIENLDSLSNYWFRVLPVMRNGIFVWSAPIKESTL